MERQVIYLDVLLCTNLLTDYLLLLLTSKITRRQTKRTRLFLSAVLASLTSLLILLPPIGFVAEMGMRVGAAFVIVLAAFPWQSPRVLIKTTGCFFAVGMAFAGVMFALWMFVAPRGMYLANGVVYFDISAVMLVMMSLLAYGAAALFRRMFAGHPMSDKVYTVHITMGEQKLTLRGYPDTGNTLRDPFMGTPVAVCSYDAIGPLLPKEVSAAYLQLHGGSSGGTMLCSVKGVRLIPFDSVGGQGLLLAFRPDVMTIIDKDREIALTEVLIGVSEKDVGGSGYDILLNRDMML